MARTTRADVFGFVPANETGKAHEAFLFFLLAGHAHFVRVNDDHEVSGIDVGSENRFFFSAQKRSRLDRDMTEHLIFGIDQPPLAVNLVGFGRKRLHWSLEKGSEATGLRRHCQPAESEVIRASKVLSRNYNAPYNSSRLRSPFPALPRLRPRKFRTRANHRFRLRCHS